MRLWEHGAWQKSPSDLSNTSPRPAAMAIGRNRHDEERVSRKSSVDTRKKWRARADVSNAIRFTHQHTRTENNKNKSTHNKQDPAMTRHSFPAWVGHVDPVCYSEARSARTFLQHGNVAFVASLLQRRRKAPRSNAYMGLRVVSDGKMEERGGCRAKRTTKRTM